jgi:tetratricopeptide (TPR) repeat protein
MSTRGDWYRKTTWSSRDAEDFERHLARSRSQRAQYIKIQAQTLAGTGQVQVADAAIQLAHRYLEEDPRGFFEVRAHLTVAEASGTKGDVSAALQAYRNAVHAEARNHGVRCCAYLEFAWFVATRGLIEAFDDVLNAMKSRQETDLVFPIAQYKYFAALALISNELKNREHARRMAQNALEAEARVAPFSRHKHVGVVEGIDGDIQKRIRRLAA